ncbi:MAG: tetratricopeptide repeat protein [Spirochaetales bacterium]|nr:tetratricopeptide repeat protein [Spirochaetales bacterium]
MARTKKKNLIILIIVLVLILIASSFALMHFFESQNKAELSEILEDVDIALSRAYYTQAESLMHQAMAISKTVTNQLRVLKRAHEYAQNSKNFILFISLCDKALKVNPGSVTLKNLQNYGFLKNGELQRLAIEAPSTKNDQLSDLIYMYWLMKSKSILPDNYLPQDRELQELTSLLNAEDPEVLFTLGQKYNNVLMLKDAALLLAKEGRYSQALEIVKNHLSHIDFDELSFFLAYDAGDYNEALKRMIRLITLYPDRKDLSILLGDLYIYLENYDESKKFYQKSIKQNPHYSEVPYSNLAWIFYQENQLDMTVSLLSQAKDIFPERVELIIQIARLLMDNQKQRDAEKILVNSYQKNPENMELAIHALDIQREFLSPQDFQNKLWEIIYRSKGSNIMAEYFLAWMFEVNAEHTDLKRLLDYMEKHKDNHKPLDWLNHYKALFFALSGEYHGALEIFDSLLEQEDNGYTRYNRGLVYFANKEYLKAEQDFKEIVKNQINFQPDNRTFYSQVHLRLAQVYSELHNLAQVRKHAQMSVDLNRDNQESYFLLKSLSELH